MRQSAVLLILWELQLKELVGEYAGSYYLRMEAAGCFSNSREHIQGYLRHHAAEIRSRVFLVGQTMLLASLGESAEDQKASQACFRRANGFVLEAITGLLSGTIASLKRISLI